MIESLKRKINEFFSNAVYVLRVCKKPEEEEIYEYTKVVLVGIVLLGVLGFLIFLIFNWVKI
ncbi:MAG: protein translocase SEC61 complex subunit gamma [Candidatus Micrarchaeia archaeon]